MADFVLRALWACAITTVLWLGLLPRAAQAQESVCGTLLNNVGPFDYRNERRKLHVVEQFHFQPEVESLTRGMRTVSPAGDLNYTLRAFPNHHRALAAIVRFGQLKKSPQPDILAYSIDCFFERALRFRPDDTVVRLLYSDYLGKTKRPKEATEQLEITRKLAPDNGLTQYNIGLVFFELGNLDEALKQAHRAMALGANRDDLMKRLKSKGRWTEPPARSELPSAAASAAPASAPAPAASAAGA